MYQIFVSEYAFADFMIQLALEPQLENQAFKMYSYTSPHISAFKRIHMMRLCSDEVFDVQHCIDDFRVDVDRCDVRGTFDLVGRTNVGNTKRSEGQPVGNNAWMQHPCIFHHVVLIKT